jgi:TonB-linked SusC/RagA family outer membrane protein
MVNRSRKAQLVVVNFLLFASILLGPPGVFAQQSKTITGTVTESSSQKPFPGVTVTVKTSKKSVITDVNGNFSINAVPSDILIFSYLGYVTRAVTVNTKTRIDVAIAEDSKALEDVVIIGYGTVAKKDLTGSVGQVNVADLAIAPVMSFDEALAGRVAGVQVSSGDGQPGSPGVNIVIRGAGSLTQDTSPLWVVDGFLLEDFDPSSVDANDVESITVLKDASATAIYGSRGANGVIVLETKKGKIGSPVINYSANYGFQRVTKQMEMMSPYEFVKYQIERGGTAAISRYTPGDLLPTAAGYQEDGNKLETYRSIKGLNWQDQIFQDGTTQIHNLSLRGGTAQTKYSLSGSYFDQKGVVIHSAAKRVTGRVSLDQIINKKINTGVNISYSNSPSVGQIAASNNGTAGHAYGYLMYAAWGFRPITGKETLLDVVDEEFLEEEFDEEAGVGTAMTLNPVLALKNEDRQSKKINLSANGYLNYKITKDLTFRQTGGYNVYDTQGYNFYNTETNRANPLISDRGVQANLSFSKRNTWIAASTLTYKKNFNRAHNVTALLGYEVLELSSENYGYGSQLIPDESLGLSGMDDGLPISQRVTFSHNRLISYFGRASYDYKSKYLFTATYRADGSSKFAPGHQWGYFPSGAFAWSLGKEKFMKDIRFISDAKVRTSYGFTGNNRVSDFASLPTISGSAIAQSYSYQNLSPVKGMYPNSIGNEALTWETTVQANIGLDLSFFKNRVEFNADIYRKTTKDLLLNANIPEMFGFSRMYRNVGSLQNEGLEFTLNTTNIKNKNFQWSTNFNISFNRNKVLALTHDETRMLSMATWDALHNGSSLWVAQINQPVALFMGFIFDGVYQYSDFNEANGIYTLKPNVADNGNTSTLPGDIKYRDINGDGTVDDFDQTIIGNPMPKHVGGLSNNLKYKGFSLNVFFQWSYGNEIFNANRIYFEGGRPQSSRNQFAAYADRWTPDNPSNTQFRSGGQGPNGRYSSKNIEDGSYIRLKTVSLGYNLPAKWLRPLNIKNLSLTATAQNLHTWTNYSGMDPEVSTQRSLGALTPGFDWSAYPRAKTIVFGVKTTL